VADRLSLKQHLARIRPQHSGEQLDEGGLSGAVLSQQTMDFSRPRLEVDVIDGGNAAERLRQANRLQRHA
jgi:hypothetical protein